MNITLYVEGGGDSKETHARCREGFRKLIERMGFTGRMPRIVACGGRNATFDDFQTALRASTSFPMFLVDSEAPLESIGDAWRYLEQRDGWVRPAGAADDHAQLMVACMETWIMADPEALAAMMGADLRKNALLPQEGLEARTKEEVQNALEQATKACGRERMYRKGRRSFQVLERLNPEALKKKLPHFRRFADALARYLAGA